MNKYENMKFGGGKKEHEIMQDERELYNDVSKIITHTHPIYSPASGRNKNLQIDKYFLDDLALEKIDNFINKSKKDKEEVIKAILEKFNHEYGALAGKLEDEYIFRDSLYNFPISLSVKHFGSSISKYPLTKEDLYLKLYPVSSLNGV